VLIGVAIVLLVVMLALGMITGRPPPHPSQPGQVKVS
jgi:hypothetical protein